MIGASHILIISIVTIYCEAPYYEPCCNSEDIGRLHAYFPEENSRINNCCIITINLGLQLQVDHL